MTMKLGKVAVYGGFLCDDTNLERVDLRLLRQTKAVLSAVNRVYSN